MSDKMPELLPCPFCGGEAMLTKSYATNGNFVVCSKCGTSINSAWPDDVKHGAIVQWNTRATPCAGDVINPVQGATSTRNVVNNECNSRDGGHGDVGEALDIDWETLEDAVAYWKSYDEKFQEFPQWVSALYFAAKRILKHRAALTAQSVNGQMLEALKGCLEGVQELNSEFQEGWDKEIARAKAAIAAAEKAQGEG